MTTSFRGSHQNNNNKATSSRSVMSCDSAVDMMDYKDLLHSDMQSSFSLMSMTSMPSERTNATNKSNQLLESNDLEDFEPLPLSASSNGSSPRSSRHKPIPLAVQHQQQQEQLQQSTTFVAASSASNSPIQQHRHGISERSSLILPEADLDVARIVPHAVLQPPRDMALPQPPTRKVPSHPPLEELLPGKCNFSPAMSVLSHKKELDLSESTSPSKAGHKDFSMLSNEFGELCLEYFANDNAAIAPVSVSDPAAAAVISSEASADFIQACHQVAVDTVDHAHAHGDNIIHNIVPTDKDVVCGRGGDAVNHNSYFIQLCEQNAHEYSTTKKRGKAGKQGVAHKVVLAVHAAGGRFLKKASTTTSQDAWEVLSEKQAIEKAAHCIRDLVRRR